MVHPGVDVLEEDDAGFAPDRSAQQASHQYSQADQRRLAPLEAVLEKRDDDGQELLIRAVQRGFVK